MAKVREVVDVNDIVGESIVWDERSETLYWVDIIGRCIHSYQPEYETLNHRSHKSRLTSIGLCEDGSAIVGLEKHIDRWDLADRFTPLVSIETDLPGNRLNEGVVAPDGSFWVGTMQNNIGSDDSALDISEPTGSLYRVTPEGDCQKLCNDVFGITNTMIWTDDGHFITADTMQNTLYRYRVSSDRLGLSEQEVFLRAFDRGLPDGSTMDEEGYIWNCRVVGGSCVLRIDPSGNIDRIIELPCSWPTSCCFGGRALDKLYVTSARFTQSQEHLSNNPVEGSLFEVSDLGVRGHLSHRFG